MNKYIQFVCGLLLFFACSCNKQDQTYPETEYAVMTILAKPVTLYTEYPVTLEGNKDIEIRPKVDGFIESIHVDEGQLVKKGQQLFTLFAPQYKEEESLAYAAIKTAEAELNTAKILVEKTLALVEKNIISKHELHTAENNLKSKHAQLAQANAHLTNAKNNIAYTSVLSPFEGIVGSIPYKVGSLVSSFSTDPLTTLSDISSIRAYYSINEKQFTDFIQKNLTHTMQQRLSDIPDVELILSNGTAYERKGKVTTVSSLIDPKTGSVKFRANFPNPEGLLRSGNSASIRIKEDIETGLLIPQKASYEIQGKHFVYSINSKQEIKSIEISLSDKAPSKTSYLVTEGLKHGDRIVTEGLSGLKEGMTINIKP